MAIRNNKRPEATARQAVPAVVVLGITGTEFLIGVCILALAVLGAAYMIHNGLTA